MSAPCACTHSTSTCGCSSSRQKMETGSGDAAAPSAETTPPPAPIFPPTTPSEICTHLYNFYFNYGSCIQDLSVFKRMTITSVTPMHSYRYVLDTFLETRTLYQTLTPSPEQVPESDVAILAPTPPTGRWELKVSPPANYVDNVAATVAIPGSELIDCNKCVTGSALCPDCDGLGFKRCSWCRGSHNVLVIGVPAPASCTYCMRTSGRERCPRCVSGALACASCSGTSKLRRSLTLNLTWRTETFILDLGRDEVTPNLLKYQHWSTIVAEGECPADAPAPLPFPDDDAIAPLAEKEMNSWISLQKDNPYTKILSFYQRIGIIPVIRLDYTLDGAQSHGFLIGAQYAPYFPTGVPVSRGVTGFLRGVLGKYE